MKIIFCEDPFNKRQPDEMYLAEAEAAQAAGFEYEIINFEALVYEKNPQKATRLVMQAETKSIGVYRGWMLKPDDYASLYNSLFQKGIRLINDPFAYKHCHYLPDSYDVIKAKTAVSVWLPIQDKVNMDDVMNLLTLFGSSPVIVKDYVKSQKHYWEEACFIPDASDHAQVNATVNRFIELQDTDLNEGLVFREFVELESLTTHSKSGMPLTKEFRVFVFNHQILAISEYWEEGDYQGTEPILSEFSNEIKNVRSQFFTMDIAKKKNGEWIIMELGDGQVAGLPEKIDPNDFYQKLVGI